MEDELPALPEGESYQEFRAPLVEGPDPDYVLQLAKSVNNTVEDLYNKAVKKRNLEARGIEDPELDRNLVYMVSEELPEAFEDLGSTISDAREVERILTGERVDIKHVDVNREEQFLEKHRESENFYREAFQQLGRPVDNRTLEEYLEEEFHLGLVRGIPEVPEPRPDNR